MSENPPRAAAAAPWYREPYAWLVFGLPASVVVACLVTAWIASRGADDLVVDDYYKAGLAINQVLARDARAAALGLALEVELARDGSFALELAAAPGFDYPASLAVRFIHATRRASDQASVGRHAGGGRYLGRAPGAFPTGAWYIELGTPAWRVVRRAVTR